MLVLWLCAAAIHAEVVISEFMASNARTLADSDGDFSDWIELHNTSGSVVSLDGWFLTDDAEMPAMWRLPNVSLAGQGYLVVFASGKNRSVAGQDLHTNFKLSAEGGYVALVQPDSVTFSSQYNYPPQRVDVAYGLATPVTSTTLIASGAPVSALIPTNDALSTNWTLPAFVPTGWISGTNGVGYGITDPPQPPAAGRLLWLAADTGLKTDLNRNVTAWADAGGIPGNWVDTVRGTPHCTTAIFPRATRDAVRFDNNIDGLLLTGAANLRVNPISVYVVGSIVAGVQSGIFIANYRDINGWALGISDAVSQRVKWFTAPPGDAFDDGVASFPGGNLTPGTNYLITATFDPGSSQKILRVLNESTTNEHSASGTFQDQTSYAPDTQLTVGNLDIGRQFLNGDIAEMLVYGSVSATQRSAVEAYLLDKYFTAQPGAPSKLVGTDVGSSMRGVNASVYTRTPFQLAGPSTFTRVTLKMQYKDGFVAYLDGQEVTRRNAPGAAGDPLPFNASALTNRPLASARVAESIDITPWAGSLTAGAHVLAVQGLSVGTNTPDFLVSPALDGQTALTPRVPSGFLQLATPGGANNTDAYLGMAADPGFSPGRGFYDGPISVSITSATPGVEIRYTLDGTLPTTNHGVVYSAPLLVSTTTILRAGAFKTGWLPSNAATHTYFFAGDVAVQSPNGQPPLGWPTSPLPTGQVLLYGMDPRVVTNPAYGSLMSGALKSLPSFSLVMDLADLFGPFGIYANAGFDGREWERAGSVELIYSNGRTGFQIDSGIRIRGGQSRMASNPKHGFRLFFRGEYGASTLKYSLFTHSPVDQFQMFDLRMDQNDSWSFLGDCCSDSKLAIYMRDMVSRDTQLAMGQPGTHSDYCHIYINGQYWGLGATQERPEADFAASYFGGNAADYDVIKVNWGTFTLYATDGDMAAWTQLYNLILSGVSTEAAYQRLLGNNPDGSRNPAYPIYISSDNLIDFMLLMLYGGNLDSPISTFSGRPNNWYAIRPRDGSAGFCFIAHDAEFMMLDVNVNRTAATSNAGDNSVLDSSPEWMWHRLLGNTSFRVRAGDRIQKHFFNGGVFTPAAAKARFLARKSEIDLAIIAESARWGDTRRATPYTRNVEWLSLVNQLAVNPGCYFDQRPAVVLSQLTATGVFPTLAAPGFSQPGGTVPAGVALAITNPNPSGTIYFTIDGTDPRRMGGSLSPAAQAYSVPVPLNAPTWACARVLNTGQWSALAEAMFYPPQHLSGLCLTELMYHPPTVGSTNGDEFEFIELKNYGTNALDLSGLTFTAGVNFTFSNGTQLSPGRFLVLARNADAFAAKYPGAALNGIYTGKLDNAGETLTLSHPLGTTVFSITYGTRAPWPVTPDGFGFSLVPRYPGNSQAPDSGAKWRASASPGGSPGTDDPEPALPQVVINEVLTHTHPPQVDFIELFNPAPIPAPVGGWFLSDDPHVPQKYRIPDGVSLPSLGFLTFNENQLNPASEVGTSFTLDSHGEQVYLFSGDANTNLTGYSHGFAFGAAAAGVPFGRYVNSVGEEQFPAQLSITLNASNAGPRVGPVVLSEIHFHPAVEGEEFLELQNITDAAVPLFDLTYPSNSWQLKGVGYSFPTNLVLEARGLLLLVATNPAVFRARYNVPTNVPVLGPYPGVLQKAGERLLLQRPDVPDSNGLPYITVDDVGYDNKAPWPPAADGSGLSLQRLNAAAYGDDPINWTAAIPTPGRLFATADTDRDGLPDAWEIANGTNPFTPDADADPDGDGMTNWQEYLAGTSPTNPSSVFRIEPVLSESDRLVLSFGVAASRSYTLCFATNLAPPVFWQPLTNITPISNGIYSLTLSTTNVSRRFYRIATP